MLDLQTIVSRERNPLEPAVVTVGSIHGGTKHNIIPDEVKMQLTVRTMNDVARKEVLARIMRMARAAARAERRSRSSSTMRDEFTPALFNEKELTHKMVGVVQGDALARNACMNGPCRWEAKISASSPVPVYERSIVTSAPPTPLRLLSRRSRG